jgi:hypothetical protein
VPQTRTMKCTLKSAAWLLAASLGLSGCATPRMKPAGFSGQELTHTVRHLRTLCLGLKVGDPVDVKFYEGASTFDRDVASGSMKGYFYGFNHWNDTITLSMTPPTFFAAGTPYYLTAIESIAPAPVESVQGPETLAQALLNTPQDFEHDLLTQ